MSKFYKNLKNSKSPYIIAEIGSNHNGKTHLAKKLILSAKKAGADCVKFQSWSVDTIFSKKKYDDNYFLNDDYRNRKDTNLKKIVKKYSFSEKQLLSMSNFCKKINIDFATTPFSLSELNFLKKKLKPKFIKVASMDLNNHPFLKQIGKKKLPILLSTGLSNIKEINEALKILYKTGSKEIILLHCISKYPTPPKETNLNALISLKQKFRLPIGFSDHTLGTLAPSIASCLGAKVIEKHFTLSKKMKGWDHKVSAEPLELKRIIDETKLVHKYLGKKIFKRPESKKIIQEFRRSAIANRDLKIGDQISMSDITFKRPGTGISPDKIYKYVGKKIKKNIKNDTVIKKNFF